jgi:Protein of unknown function (DUF3124)
MSRRILVMLFAVGLVGAIWAARTMITTARAQTAADSPAAFTSPLTELPTIQTMKIRHTVFVPAYSTIRLEGGKGKVDLATTLTIHNTSEEKPLILLRVDYFDTAGNLLHRYLEKPVALRPLGSGETFVPAQDTRGGTGANFIVEWAGERPITEPLIEAVMLGISGSHGFSFTSRGQTMIPATSQ